MRRLEKNNRPLLPRSLKGKGDVKIVFFFPDWRKNVGCERCRVSGKRMQGKKKESLNLLILYKCGSAHVRRTSSVCLPAGSRPVGYRQDIFAQEMDSSIVCTFVQTVQLRGCAGTTV